LFKEVEYVGALTRAIRNISRRKMRAFLVVIALGFSLAIMVSLPPGILANQQSTQSLTANYDNTVSQMEQQLTLIMCTNSSSSNTNSSFTPPFGGGYARFGGFGGQENYMDESVADAIDSIQGVETVVPILDVPEGVTSQTFTGFGGRTFTFNVSAYTIEGVPLNSSLISSNYVPLPTNITEGRNLLTGDSGVVVLSLNNTEYFGVSVGGDVNINGTDFKVVGVHGESGSSGYALGQAADVRTLYMNISDAQAVSGLAGQISTVNVYADNSSDVSNVAQEISSLFPQFSVTTEESELQTIENLYNSTLATNEAAISQTQTVAFEEIVVAVVATSLIVLFVMLYTVRERTKEIGTLKAIGFSNWNVMSQFILEGMLLSFVAGIVAIAIGSVGAPTLSALLLPHIANPFSTSGGRFGGGGFRVTGTSGAGAPGVDIASAVATAAPSPGLMLVALGGAVVLGALGSLYPAWRASRTRPAEAMRYE
jgi:ABC-type antimicrobial peptide transport system permease subunit